MILHLKIQLFLKIAPAASSTQVLMGGPFPFERAKTIFSNYFWCVQGRTPSGFGSDVHCKCVNDALCWSFVFFSGASVPTHSAHTSTRSHPFCAHETNAPLRTVAATTNNKHGAGNWGAQLEPRREPPHFGQLTADRETENLIFTWFSSQKYIFLLPIRFQWERSAAIYDRPLHTAV